MASIQSSLTKIVFNKALPSVASSRAMTHDSGHYSAIIETMVPLQFHSLSSSLSDGCADDCKQCSCSVDQLFFFMSHTPSTASTKHCCVTTLVCLHKWRECLWISSEWLADREQEAPLMLEGTATSVAIGQTTYPRANTLSGWMTSSVQRSEASLCRKWLFCIAFFSHICCQNSSPFTRSCKKGWKKRWYTCQAWSWQTWQWHFSTKSVHKLIVFVDENIFW